MNQFAINIKFLRNKKGWSQGALAEQMNIGRSTVADYERKKSEPSFDQLINLSGIFNVSIDDLLKKNLNEEAYEIIKNKDLKILTISVDKANNEHIELVPQKAQAGYTLGYADMEYIANLPTVSLPNLKQKTYRAFEITGLSMLPVEPGSIILTSYVENYEHANYKKPHIIVTENDGIVFKRLQNKNESTILAISDNPEFLPYTINKQEILELWQFEAVISFNYPEQNTLQRLEEKLDIIIDRTSGF